MNEQKRWQYIESLFEQMTAICDEILQMLGEPKPQIMLTGKEVGDWLKENSNDEWQAYCDWLQRLHPISPDEAKRMLEDAKDYLMEGE